MRAWAELSGENPRLARGELAAALALEEGRSLAPEDPAGAWVPIEVPDGTPLAPLAHRLAFAHALWVPVVPPGSGDIEPAARREGNSRASARFDRAGPEIAEGWIRRLARLYAEGGGKIRLRDPERRYLVRTGPGGPLLLRCVAEVDRTQYERRRMPTLPYQRPVSLPPRRARAAANLAGATAGRRIADPFVGTGALLLEAGLLGARLFGADRDAAMIRGTVANLAAFGVEAERLVVHDAAAALEDLPWPEVDAVVTDPPYGRASGSGGERPRDLLARVLPAWADRLAPGGRLVLVGPAEDAPELPGLRLELAVPDRVHRSLTREFRVYRRPTIREGQ